jgi:hemolysin activation/secretion protein
MALGTIGRKLALSQTDPNQTNFSENELFLIGGLNDLRGFNQESIISNAYGIIKSELHFRASRMLGFYSFFDKSWVSSYSNNLISTHWPSSAGFGILLQSGAGNLSITYAMANGFGQSFKLRDAKLHIEYSTSF